jgi:hypothetical protein
VLKRIVVTIPLLNEGQKIDKDQFFLEHLLIPDIGILVIDSYGNISFILAGNPRMLQSLVRCVPLKRLDFC